MKYEYLVRRTVTSEARVVVELSEQELDTLTHSAIEERAVEQAKREDTWVESEDKARAELWRRFK